LLPVYTDGVDLKGHGFAAIPFMEEVLRFLRGRCAWFWKEHVANPDLHATTEFDHYCFWYDTGDDDMGYEGGDLEAIKALAEDDEFMEAVALTEETGEFQIVDGGRVPEDGIWTDLVWLHIQRSRLVSRPDEDRPVELWWTAIDERTGCDLRTCRIQSDRLEQWLAEIERAE
jgi:hypothetical protein